MGYWQGKIVPLNDTKAEDIVFALDHYECFEGKYSASIEEDDNSISIIAHGDNVTTVLKIFCAGKTMLSRTHANLGREVSAILDGNGIFKRTCQHYSRESGLMGDPQDIVLNPSDEERAIRRLCSIARRTLPIVQAIPL